MKGSDFFYFSSRCKKQRLMEQASTSERARAAHRRLARQEPSADALRLNLHGLVGLHGDASVAVLLMLMATLTVLPVAGAGTVLSFGLLALAWAWARGQEAFELPPRLGALSLNERWTRRCLGALAWTYALARRCLRPRWTFWSHRHTRTLWGGWIALMAAIIFLPLPLGNVLPSLSLMLLSLGWMFRDGVALILSTVLGAAAVAYTVSLGHVATALLQRAWAWLPA